MTVLILGATGLQGGAVVKHMLARGQKLRALTRTPTAPKAKALWDQGVEIAHGDLSRPETLRDAFDGVRAVFSVQDFYGTGTGLIGELEQGRAVITAAKAAGVSHIVQSTMGDGHRPGGPDHFVSKALLERDLRASGLSHTLLGTVWFMDNLLNPEMKPHLMFPVLAGSLAPQTQFAMLATDDLGWVAAEALCDPEAWDGRKLNLAGDVMRVEDMKTTYAQVTGKRPKGWRLPAVVFRRLVPEFADQLRWHNEVNFAFGTKPLMQIRPNRTTLAGFLQKHGITGM